MKNFDASQLSHFTGTERYYRISRRHLLTDGTKYLAEEAECFWMMDAIASHLSEIGTDNWFVQVRVTLSVRPSHLDFRFPPVSADTCPHNDRGHVDTKPVSSGAAATLQTGFHMCRQPRQ
jgi:hypothetical protein